MANLRLRYLPTASAQHGSPGSKVLADILGALIAAERKVKKP